MAWKFENDYLRLKDEVGYLDPSIKFYGQVTMLSKLDIRLGTGKF